MRPVSATATTDAMTLSTPPAPATPTVVTGWSSLLEDEERHVARQGFGAGVLVIDYEPALTRHVDADLRALTEAAVLGVIDGHLGWAERAAPIAPGRLGVVVVPVQGAEALAYRAHLLARDLRECDIDVEVAHAVRRRIGGLQSAAARADAAIDHRRSRRDA